MLHSACEASAAVRHALDEDKGNCRWPFIVCAAARSTVILYLEEVSNGGFSLFTFIREIVLEKTAEKSLAVVMA